MIHEAGRMTVDGVQRCVRCSEILTDYRGSMVPAGTPPLGGFADGAYVEVSGRNPRFSDVVDAIPDCETRQ